MVGLEVRPVTASSRAYRSSVPLVSRSRVMLSSQRLWPARWRSPVGFIVPPRANRALRPRNRAFPASSAPGPKDATLSRRDRIATTAGARPRRPDSGGAPHIASAGWRSGSRTDDDLQAVAPSRGAEPLLELDKAVPV